VTTYTFIARSAYDASNVATFTLYDDRMTVDTGVGLEEIGRAIRSRTTNKAEEQTNGSRLAIPQVPGWVKPVAVRLAQEGTRPFSVADVDASSSEDGSLMIRSWVRVGGLRLAPLQFYWERVDNPDAAVAFTREVARRREDIHHPGRFNGPLDYWLVWVVGGLVLTLLISQQFKGGDKA